jgi:hypothetical protein
MQIVEEEDFHDAKTQMVKAQPGDPEPAVPERILKPIRQANKALPRSERTSLPNWIYIHRGKRYAEDVLLDLEPMRFAICILHLLLRFVAQLLKKTMLVRVKDNANLAKILYEWLVGDINVHINTIHKTADNVDDFHKSIAEHNFAGREAHAVLDGWQAGMELVYPDAARTNRNEKKKYQQSCDIWAKFKEGIWGVLNDADMDKAVKADKIRAAATELCDLWRSALGASGVQYVHNAVGHLPKQILQFPVDIWHLQIQSLEHQNKIRKQLCSKKLVNLHKPGNQRYTEVTEYKHHKTNTLCKVKERKDADGNIIKAGLRWSGTCTAYQLMHLTALQDYVSREMASGKKTAEELQKIKHQQRLKRLAARKRTLGEAYDAAIDTPSPH